MSSKKSPSSSDENFDESELSRKLKSCVRVVERRLTPSGLLDSGDFQVPVLFPDDYLGDSWDTSRDSSYTADFVDVPDTTQVNDAAPDLLPISTLPFNPVTNFDLGVFTVGETGQVSVDYLYDGGHYQGQLAIFSLNGMESFDPNSTAFIHEAATRALSNSNLGHILIDDLSQAAHFASGDNSGQYLGEKTFSMEAGDRFGMILVPNGTVQAVFDNPNADGDLRPLFSLATANPNDAYQVGQITDMFGDGKTFVFEDLRVDNGSDKDFNDLVFHVKGATGQAATFDQLIADGLLDPEKDWRDGELGQMISDYIPKSNQPLIGVIDTGFAANNPDIDYSRITLGTDYIGNDANPLLQAGEGNEHGTHVLGIIGATQDNGIGIDGINDDAPIWLGRAVGSGEWANSLTEFVNHSIADGRDNAVVNLSMDLTQVNPDGSVTTRYEFTPQERAALEFARQNNILIVVAAGNDGGTMSALGQASQEFDNIITVGAADGLDKVDYSSYGEGLDILADGGTIDEPIISTVGNGTDLQMLIDGLDGFTSDMESLSQSILGISVASSLNPSITDPPIILPANISSDLASFVENAYETSWNEVLTLLEADSDFLSSDLSDEENSLLQSQNDLEILLAELEVFLNTLPSDFLDLIDGSEFNKLSTIFDITSLKTIDEDLDLDLGVGEMYGTSVATATVTGAVSQIWAVNPSLSYIQVKEILKMTALDLKAPGWDEETGAGLLNLSAAIELAKRTNSVPYEPESFLNPTTWAGEGILQPAERAASDAFMGQYYDWVPYTIRSGDTLSGIASRTMGSGSPAYYNFIAIKNGIANPNLIYAGRTLLVPKEVSAPSPQPESQPPTLTVQGGIRQRWLQSPWLGAPVSAEIDRGNGVKIQYFTNGYIIWNGRRATAYRNRNSTFKVSTAVKPHLNSRSYILQSARQAILRARQAMSRMLSSLRTSISTFRTSLNRSMQIYRLVNFRVIQKIQTYRPTNGIDFTADLFTGNFLFGPTVCGVSNNRDFNNVRRVPYSDWNPLWNKQQAACAVHDYEINKTGKDPIRDWTDPSIIKAHARLANTSTSPFMGTSFAFLAGVGSIGYGVQKLGQSSTETYNAFNRWGANLAPSVIKWAYPKYPI